jgi:hypothetical protein
MSITQGEAVYQAVCSVLENSELNEKVELNDSETKRVADLVFTMFKTGVCQHKGNPSDEALRKYIPGLVNNWLRKDLRLNGGSKYQAKKPGSRAGSGDEQLKAMRDLLSMTTDPLARAAIELEIQARREAIKPKTIVNIDALPPSLRKFVTQQ